MRSLFEEVKSSTTTASYFFVSSLTRFTISFELRSVTGLIAAARFEPLTPAPDDEIAFVELSLGFELKVFEARPLVFAEFVVCFYLP